MIGYLKPEKMELVMKDYQYYKMYYCSICRHLVRNNLRVYSFLTGYEGTLLAMLYNELVVQNGEAILDNCSGVPLAKVPVLPADHEAIELGSYLCLLAFQVKFQDNLLDETGFWITKYNQFLKNHIEKSANKQKEVYEKFKIDLKYVHKKQIELRALEEDSSVRDSTIYLDHWGSLFAYIMTQPFSEKIDEERCQALREMFTGLGKIINLLDAMADVKEDAASGQFNPILKAESPENSKDREWLESAYKIYSGIIQTERQKILKLFPVLALRESLSIVQNILTHCLDRELKKVFDSMVLDESKEKGRLLFNCKDF
jgi:hypothetical protein